METRKEGYERENRGETRKEERGWERGKGDEVKSRDEKE